ncbi:hypothetical protein B9Z55_016554 [Caenorhabditis nigoni]|uniref:C2H2-type domain-containing protein n=1 Tax=Caenorhabditis nigoni TaxID=1611254 RepID=A0A2G5T5J8_9PELO|nr:hypothetical protein B9Z55_016554 [Caenorhabditis nigoni]
MADNEAKARQKMAEGRKKLQGGGGFFSKVFGGGGGSGEAADLFIQVNNSSVVGLRNSQEMEDEEEEEEEEEASSSEIECSYEGCLFVASNLLEYEEHYASHSFQCCECGTRFDTAHRLEVHHDEQHNPFFQIQVQRQPDSAHFRCLHPTCELKFSNTRTRDEHARVVHFIQGDSSRRRKFDEIGTALSNSMGGMSIGDEEGSGWTGMSQFGLSKARKTKKATRKIKNTQ